MIAQDAKLCTVYVASGLSCRHGWTLMREREYRRLTKDMVGLSHLNVLVSRCGGCRLFQPGIICDIA